MAHPDSTAVQPNAVSEVLPVDPDAPGFLPQHSVRSVLVPAEMAVDARLVAFPVAGHCMEPQISDGDLAVVDMANRCPRPGDIAMIFVPGDGLKIKRWTGLNGCFVDAHGLECLLPDASIKGVVVGSISTHSEANRG